MKSPVIVARFPCIALAALVAAGCSSPQATDSKPVAAQQQAAASRYASQTLADLEKSEITITEGSIEQASIEGALESYKQAVQLFNDPEKRVESLRRMADLTMAASQEKEGVSLAQEPVVPVQLSEEGEVKLDQEIDAMLFKRFIASAETAKTQEEKYRMLDLAGGIVPELEGSDLAANYNTAILLYQSVIKNSKDPSEKAEAYYLLAKAYDISGEHEKSIATLKELGRLYPNSTFYLESQFRLAESYFTEGEFDLATMAYSEVVRAGSATPFLQQAIYKRGWSQYKVSEYEKGLVDFFSLIDLLQKSGAKGKDLERDKRLMEDAFRVASMSFNNLDGAKSVTEWFRKNGHRPYEAEIYRSLGDIYVKQERFADASETFDAYVALYPTNDRAPEFSSAAIKALQDGGFPTQVLPAKARFVKAYGIDSAFWKTHEKQRTEYLPLLKSHILDLAKHYHATAQKEKDAPGYLVAAGWYKQWLLTDPKDGGAATVNQLYAEALFSGNSFLPAIREFERTAYEYPGYEKASEAGYFGLVAYQAYGEQLKGDPKADAKVDAQLEARYKALLPKKIEASTKFARTFPAHPKAPYVLQSVVEDQLARKDVAAAVSSAGVLVSLNPPAPAELQLYGWQTIGNGEFDMGRHPVAEFAYTKVLAFPALKPEDRKTYKERLAASIYKQGEKLIAEGKELEGAQQFMRVGTIVADADLRANAEFDAATIFLKKNQWATAIPVLEQFRVRYPKNPLAETIPDKLAVAYEKTGNFAGAAAELETIHNANLKTNPEVARAALWQAAELTEKTKNEPAIVRLYSLYIVENPAPLEPRMEAQYRLLKIYEKRGDLKQRDAMLGALSTGARTAGSDASPRVRYLGAFASFTLAEPIFQRFTDYKLKAPLKVSLAEKRKLMSSALEAYSVTAKMGVADFASAAQFRTAEVYRILAADLMSSERPRGLDEMALEQYQLLLEEQALPFEDQAITLYTQNTELVKQDIYDDWIRKSYAALAILQPGRFAKKEQAEDYVDIIY